MTLEQLLFVALLVLVPLLNFLAGLLRKRMQRRAEPEMASPPPPAAPAPRESSSPAALPTRVADLPRARPSAPPPRSPVAQARAPRLGPSDVRRGVVLMTILGPCPGLDRQAPGRPRG